MPLGSCNKTDANGIATSYGYNADGQLVTETLGAVTTTTTRNQFGEVTKLYQGNQYDSIVL